MRKVSFFIVGAPKCGTTALADFMNQHPAIGMLRKEMHHFGRDLAFRRQRPDAQEYQAALDRLPAAEIYGDASVFYLFSKLAAQEIKAYNPDAKIIIMLRNPVDAMFSLHGQLVQMADEDLRDFQTAINAQETRRQGQDIPKHCHAPFALQYEEVTDFAPQVRRYMDVFGQENVLILFQEDLKAQPEKLYQQALNHIGVTAQNFEPQFRVVNERRDLRFAVLRIMEKQISAQTKEAIKYALPLWLRRLLVGFYQTLAYRSPADSKIDPHYRAQLLEKFLPRIIALENVTGRDLSHWKPREREVIE
jgi:hypothetical protein